MLKKTKQFEFGFFDLIFMFLSIFYRYEMILHHTSKSVWAKYWLFFLPEKKLEKNVNTKIRNSKSYQKMKLFSFFSRLSKSISWKSHQVLISPTFYNQLFCMKVFCAAFMCWQFGFVIFWRKEIGTKYRKIVSHQVNLSPSLIVKRSILSL